MNDRVHAGLRVLNLRAFDADSLDKAFCQYALVVHVKELILQRRTSAINN